MESPCSTWNSYLVARDLFIAYDLFRLVKAGLETPYCTREATNYGKRGIYFDGLLA
jgi:hypothetical protein